MARSARYFFVAALAAFFFLGQVVYASQASQAAAPEAGPPATAKAHGAMPMELTKALDSKKMKEGDPVTARIIAELHTATGGTIPAGSKVSGHITEAKARSKGDPQAALGIAFDQITTPDGKTMAIKSVLQAVGPSRTAGGTPDASPSIGPGMMAGHEGQGAGTTPPPMPSVGQTVHSSVPVLNSQSKGVVGIKGLELGENSVLLSSGKAVNLDSGTQMIVQVEIE